jgi:hypothetical protein
MDVHLYIVVVIVSPISLHQLVEHVGNAIAYVLQERFQFRIRLGKPVAFGCYSGCRQTCPVNYLFQPVAFFREGVDNSAATVYLSAHFFFRRFS